MGKNNIEFQGMRSLIGKTIGVNQQSVAYQQFLYLTRKAGLTADSFKEYPIGFGGIEELLTGRVDAFLGYSTNQILEVQQRDPTVKEVTFDELGLRSYGLVLVASSGAEKQHGSDTFSKFLNATLKGYEIGATDTEGAIEALRKAEPTLTPEKLKNAISRITTLRRIPADSLQLDDWLLEDNVSADSLKRMRDFISKK